MAHVLSLQLLRLCSASAAHVKAGTGDVVEAVRHIRTLHKEMRMVQMMDEDFGSVLGQRKA